MFSFFLTTMICMISISLRWLIGLIIIKWRRLIKLSKPNNHSQTAPYNSIVSSAHFASIGKNNPFTFQPHPKIQSILTTFKQTIKQIALRSFHAKDSICWQRNQWATFQVRYLWVGKKMTMPRSKINLEWALAIGIDSIDISYQLIASPM